jgi:hypothetical protein
MRHLKGKEPFDLSSMFMSLLSTKARCFLIHTKESDITASPCGCAGFLVRDLKDMEESDH